jgi:predicted HTH transcriptional regulator
MITKDELQELFASTETYRIERTISTTDKDKFGEAVCAFANDMPDSGKPGYLLIGVRNDGSLNGFKASDELLQKFAALRSDGNILPIPSIAVDSFSFPDGDVIVVEVQPSDQPPVRYRGRTWIRIGPRRDIASPAEETMLAERKAQQEQILNYYRVKRQAEQEKENQEYRSAVAQSRKDQLEEQQRHNKELEKIAAGKAETDKENKERAAAEKERSNKANEEERNRHNQAVENKKSQGSTGGSSKRKKGKQKKKKVAPKRMVRQNASSQSQSSGGNTMPGVK